MDLPRTAPSSSPPEIIRFAVFESVEDQKTDIARITFSKAETGRWTAQVSGKSDPPVLRIKKALDQYAEIKKSVAITEEASTTDSPVPDWRLLIDTLGQAGFSLEELPAGDFQFAMNYDPKSGNLVATHMPLHKFATPDPSLTRDLAASLANTFRNIPNDLAHEIDQAIRAGNIEEALASVKSANEGGKFIFPPSAALLNAFVKFDVLLLSPADRRMLRNIRITVASGLQEYDVAGSDAEALLAEEDGIAPSDTQKNDLQSILALASMKRGNKETALMIWRKILKNPATLVPGSRAWIWRNISLTLPPNDPESIQAARYAADAFLEAGDKHEAGKSLMQLAKSLLHEDPAEAIGKIDEILALLDSEGLIDKNLRAAALHTRANCMAQLGNHSEAYVNAREAVDLRRGLFGVEAEFVSSLFLASIEASYVRQGDEAITLKAEADKLSNEIASPRFRFGRRLEQLAALFDPEQTMELIRDAKTAGDLEVAASVRIVQAMNDSSLKDIERLELLEESLRELDNADIRESAKQTTWSAIGRQLLRMGEPERAETWYRKILAISPLDAEARDHLIHCLWQRGKWGDAAIFLRKQITIRGEMPGLLFAYGRSLFEAGDFPEAIPVLTKASDLAGSNESLKANALNLRERALRTGAIPTPSKPIKELTVPITRDDFQVAINEFARFIEAEKRMGFWNKEDSQDYTWIARPEKRAQDFLHTFLKAKFGDRIMLFEEIFTGAGRLDLYVQALGGMAIIVELKMCGFGYSSRYAADGEDQILHYMENRRTALGYLIVFDARLNDFGQRLLQGHASDRFTVVENFVNVTPRASFRPATNDCP